MNITIKKAGPENLIEIIDILNAATLKLLEKGVMQWEYPWPEEQVLSYINKDEFYIALADGNICGCIGLKKYENNLFNGDNSGLYAYHLAVHPDYETKGIGMYICSWMHQFAKENNITIYFDCWAGNDKLRRFYTYTGFEYMGDYPEEDYFVSAFKTSR